METRVINYSFGDRSKARCLVYALNSAIQSDIFSPLSQSLRGVTTIDRFVLWVNRRSKVTGVRACRVSTLKEATSGHMDHCLHT